MNQIPLAVAMRPRNLNEFIGQEHVLGQGKILRRAIIAKKIPSLILWGPAGCGKTTLGYIVARELDCDLEYLNAAFASVAEVKKMLIAVKEKLNAAGRRTVLFIDEIHRFSKTQQETLVPDTEAGSVIMVAATIYNPAYYLISSLISRSIVAEFKPLSNNDIVVLLKHALTDSRGLSGIKIKITDKALNHIAVFSGGDGRKALSALELGVTSTQESVDGYIMLDINTAKEIIQKNLFYDKKDDYHYNTISAFIKSIRGSDPDSALYWLAKMIQSGEDPRFIARRMVILASEDIGNADPHALVLATSCFQAVEFVGYPEADLILAQTVIYLCCAPKSNSAYEAINAAKDAVSKEETAQVPEHLYPKSQNYKYPHDFGGYVKQDYGSPRKFYFPKESGYEKKLKDFLDMICR